MTLPGSQDRRLDAWLLLAVAVGGAVGALARWGLGETWPAAPDAFPWTTFGVNLAGTALLAMLPAVSFVRRRRLLPPALGTGVLGGFTTMSGFSEETRSLLAHGHPGLGAAYVMGTVGACVLAVAVVDRVLDRDPAAHAARAEFEVGEGDL